MARIVEPTTEIELGHVRVLMRAFVSWVRVRYAAKIDFVERYFDAAAFEAELKGLPGTYARPKGRLLLATDDNVAAGCIAFRDLGVGVCEMKRLYVDTHFHGKGIGRVLVSNLIHEAKAAGFLTMRLDTGPNNSEAISLYASAGFQLIQPYYEVPNELHSWLVFMELDLTTAQRPNKRTTDNSRASPLRV